MLHLVMISLLALAALSQPGGKGEESVDTGDDGGDAPGGKEPDMPMPTHDIFESSMIWDFNMTMPCPPNFPDCNNPNATMPCPPNFPDCNNPNATMTVPTGKGVDSNDTDSNYYNTTAGNDTSSNRWSAAPGVSVVGTLALVVVGVSMF